MLCVKGDCFTCRTGYTNKVMNKLKKEKDHGKSVYYLNIKIKCHLI